MARQNRNSFSRKKIISLVSSASIGFIFTLMDTISYGRVIFNVKGDDPIEKETMENISLFIYITSTILAQFVYSFQTKLDSGIMASCIVEIFSMTAEIFHQIKNAAEQPSLSTIITNTLACTAISAFIFSFMSFLIMKAKIGKYLTYIPNSLLMGLLGLISLYQFQAAFSEIGLIHSQDIKDSNILTLLGVLFLISIFGYFLQKKRPDNIILLPGLILSYTLLFHFAKYVFKVDDTKLYETKWLPPFLNQTISYKAITDNFNFKELSASLIFKNLQTIFSLSFLNLIHLPINIATFASVTGVKASFDDELYTQFIGNLVTGFCFVPSYFICSNSIFFRRSGGTSKIFGLITTFSYLILYKYGLLIKSYVPTLVIAFIPFLIGASLFESAFICSYRDLRYKNKIDFLVILTTTFFSFTCGIIIGMLVGLICNSLIVGLARRNDKNHRKYQRKHCDIDVDGVLHFANIDHIVQKIDKHKEFPTQLIINLSNCSYVDWKAHDILVEKTEELECNVIFIGKPKYFHPKLNKRILWYATDELYEESLKEFAL